MDRAISPAVITTEHKIVYKVVLTGGPCAGKTTALARFRTFFENLGWKVYCAPEAATILFCGGIEVTKLNKKQIRSFQENVLKTIMQIEQTYFDLANDENRNCLIVCDRGTMDPSAFCSNEEWQEILKSNGWNTHMLRDQRYDQVVHLQTAAKGAEAFYQLINNKTRTEGIEQARDRDTKAAQVTMTQ
jgi:thymidylate kinase